ncbi:hypothetical protein [Cellulomonas rhizosphaerae]|uniref:Uncharacterized protein n=1 Tax=Cellulomonas rhizosphaerae TaxID=2293719 RepID=A0A413RPQ6_9CELL|nr:hypothetical protein [Cellulomonas rhizosphaerae]RHA43972.1 hypothetical protein D1825_03610 [Cellulomonas rhizosphaerae]
MSTTTSDATESAQRRVARGVTVGTVVALLLVTLSGLEAWPLTSFRLFSTVRTGTSVGLELEAVAADGTRSPVRLPANQVMSTTTHQFAHLAHARPEVQRAKVRAWLATAGIDPATLTEVDLVRTTRSMDPTGTSHVVGNEIVAVVRP